MYEHSRVADVTSIEGSCCVQLAVRVVRVPGKQQEQENESMALLLLCSRYKIRFCISCASPNEFTIFFV